MARRRSRVTAIAPSAADLRDQRARLAGANIQCAQHILHRRAPFLARRGDCAARWRYPGQRGTAERLPAAAAPRPHPGVVISSAGDQVQMTAPAEHLIGALEFAGACANRSRSTAVDARDKASRCRRCRSAPRRSAPTMRPRRAPATRRNPASGAAAARRASAGTAHNRYIVARLGGHGPRNSPPGSGVKPVVAFAPPPPRRRWRAEANCDREVSDGAVGFSAEHAPAAPDASRRPNQRGAAGDV